VEKEDAYAFFCNSFEERSISLSNLSTFGSSNFEAEMRLFDG
jgi:hypothetical protein